MRLGVEVKKNHLSNFYPFYYINIINIYIYYPYSPLVTSNKRKVRDVTELNNPL